MQRGVADDTNVKLKFETILPWTFVMDYKLSVGSQNAHFVSKTFLKILSLHKITNKYNHRERFH